MLKYHHTGLIVKDSNEAKKLYSQLFGTSSISKSVLVQSQGVEICFVKTGVDSYLELISQVSEASMISKMLKKNVTYYHVAYQTDCLQDSIYELENNGCTLLNVFNSEAFENQECAFLFSPQGELLELVPECTTWDLLFS